MSLRAEVDRDACMSSGKCVADAPQAFEFDDDEIARTVGGARSLDRGRLIAVARNCPAEAIAVFDDDDAIDLD
jgi:ferredoxin